MSHTPGPWFAHDFSGVSEGDVEASDFSVSCTTPDHITVAVMGNGLFCRKEEWEANARLIAAAPELLEALESMLQSFLITQSLDDYSIDAPCNKARAAIAKAKGEV